MPPFRASWRRYLSPYGLFPGLIGGLCAGLLAGTLNALIITRLKIMPFIATLATMLAASGTALLLANNQSVSVSYDTYFTNLGQGDLLSFMRPEWVDAEDAGILGGILGFILSFPDAGLHRARRLYRRAPSSSTIRPSGAMCWPSAAAPRRRA